MTSTSESIQETLVSMRIGTGEPCWSSDMLRQLFDGAKGDVHPLIQVYGEALKLLVKGELTLTVAAFIKELAKTGFSRFRDSYESCKLDFLCEGLGVTKRQPHAFFCLYTLPSYCLTPEVVVAILQSLHNTKFWEEAVSNLSYEFENNEVKRLLKSWSLLDNSILESNEVGRVLRS